MYSIVVVNRTSVNQLSYWPKTRQAISILVSYLIHFIVCSWDALLAVEIGGSGCIARCTNSCLFLCIANSESIILFKSIIFIIIMWQADATNISTTAMIEGYRPCPQSYNRTSGAYDCPITHTHPFISSIRRDNRDPASTSFFPDKSVPLISNWLSHCFHHKSC